MGEGGFGSGDFTHDDIFYLERNPTRVLDKMDCIVRNVRDLLTLLLARGAKPHPAWCDGCGRLPTEADMAVGRQHDYHYSSTTEDEST